jgi:hypothetical protein
MTSHAADARGHCIAWLVRTKVTHNARHTLRLTLVLADSAQVTPLVHTGSSLVLTTRALLAGDLAGEVLETGDSTVGAHAGGVGQVVRSMDSGAVLTMERAVCVRHVFADSTYDTGRAELAGNTGNAELSTLAWLVLACWALLAHVNSAHLRGVAARMALFALPLNVLVLVFPGNTADATN